MKFPRHMEALDFVMRRTPISAVTDKQIWDQIVSPTVKAFLGPLRSHESGFSETTQELFPGDHVSNMNGHLLYGAQAGFLRFPYIWTIYKTEYGALVIKRDGSKFEASGWYGDLFKGKGQLIFKAGLRDRRYDGTKWANDSALIDFPYDDPQLNGRFLGADKNTVEQSLYSFDPLSSVADMTGEKEYDRFIKQPFEFLDRPELFMHYFDRAWKSDRAPGQNSKPIPDVGKLVLQAMCKLAATKGYDFIEGANSHYHVCMWTASLGYSYTLPHQAATMAAFTAGLQRIKDSGVKLTRPQESWVVVLQSLRPLELIPGHLYMGDPQLIWPQDNISPASLWVHKALK